jgi:hypothetical protein
MKVRIAYYSTYGNVFRMAKLVDFRRVGPDTGMVEMSGLVACSGSDQAGSVRGARRSRPQQVGSEGPVAGGTCLQS